MFDDLLEIDETKKDEKTKEKYPKESSYNTLDPFVFDSVLKQTLQIQEEQKRLEEENKLKEEESKRQNSKKVVFRTRLEVLEPMGEEREPNLHEFVYSTNRAEYREIIEDRANLLTVNSVGFKNALVQGKDISLIQKGLIKEYIDIGRKEIVTPDELPVLSLQQIHSLRVDTLERLITLGELCDVAIEDFRNKVNIIGTEEQIMEIEGLLELRKTYYSAIAIISGNADVYIEIKGENLYGK